MTDDESAACKDLQDRVAVLEAHVAELRAMLALDVQGPKRPPEMCIACGNPCEGKGGIGHPVTLQRA